jgi:hypothetical protein
MQNAGPTPFLAFSKLASCNARTRPGKICAYAGLIRFREVPQGTYYRLLPF